MQEFGLACNRGLIISEQLTGSGLADIVPPFIQHGGEIFRQLRFVIHFPAGARMDEAEGLGVEGMTGHDGKAVFDKLLVFGEDRAFHDPVSSVGVIVK